MEIKDKLITLDGLKTFLNLKNYVEGNDFEELLSNYLDELGVQFEKSLNTPTDYPTIYFDGALPTTKLEGSFTSSCHIHSRNFNIHCFATIKVQGNSSTKYNKKNFTITFYADSDCTVKFPIDFGWGMQSKYVIKANWIDITHSRNIVSAQLWGDIVKFRTDYDTLPELLTTSPNQGAIDGFPILFYADNVYWGRYTMNIPKDAWMSNMDKNNPNHLILCGEASDSAMFRALAVWDELDWTDELHSEVPADLLARFNEFISFVMNSSDSDFKEHLGDYVDLTALLDYDLFGLLSCNLDGFKKNQLWFSYDGNKFIPSVYDLDSTFGLYWDGSKLLEYTYPRTSYEDFNKGGNLLYIRLDKLFKAELIAEYERLISNPMSYNNVINRFEEFIRIVPENIVKEDYATTTGGGKCTSIPSKTTNNIQQLRSWYNGRLKWVLEYLESIEEPIPENPDVPDPDEPDVPDPDDPDVPDPDEPDTPDPDEPDTPEFEPVPTYELINASFAKDDSTLMPINTGLYLTNAENTNWTMFVFFGLGGATSYTCRIIHSLDEDNTNYPGFQITHAVGGAMYLTVQLNSKTKKAITLNAPNTMALHNYVCIKRRGSMLLYSFDGVTWIETINVGVNNNPLVVGGIYKVSELGETGIADGELGREMNGKVTLRYWDSDVEDISYFVDKFQEEYTPKN